ncbi:octopamine receptor beta-2R-like [Amphiura filiformis]|uniref:octopamine receptor beta-2R-like n=1 Tax=Amphiura filiformis TaxID=82378 RepID=UPI003B21008F
MNPQNSTFEFEDPIQRKSLAIIFIGISITGLAGNSLVLISVILCRKLHNLNNIFVVNLSIADIITCSLLPVNVVILWNPIEDTPPVAEWICTASTAVNFICVGVSVNTLASISVIRLLVVTRPLQTHKPRWLIRLWILFTWLFPSAMILLPALILPGGFVLGYNTKYGVCTQKSSHPYISIYNGINLLTFFLPLVVIIMCYTAIFIRHRHHSKKMIQSSGENISDSNISLSSIYSISQFVKHTSDTRIKHTMMFKIQRRQIQITKNMLCVVCVFILCILPYVIVAQKIIQGDIVVRLVPYCGAFIYLNSAVNPFIYARHPNFRRVFRLMLTCNWNEIPQPSMTLKFLTNYRI